MSATATGTLAPPGPPDLPAGAAAPRRRWRWVRLAAPFTVVLLLLIYTVVAHALQQPDPADLTPTGTGPGGGSRLAQLLTAQGVEIQRATSSREALTDAGSGNVTLFIPAPALMNPDYLRLLRLLPRYTRVVLVAPSRYTLDSGLIPVGGTGTRWATAAVEPGCDLPEARQAGVAAVHRVHYRPATADGDPGCYLGSLLRVRVNAAEVLLVGAGDPFRNGRIGEYGNAALATGLLSPYPRVVWLELHDDEPPPDQPAAAASRSSTPPPAAADGSGPPGQPDQRGDGGGGGDGGGSGGNQSSGQSPPLPVPRQFWAVLTLIAAAMLAVAVARARRLGPPVAEPLPVAVRGLETVTGRGHLYRRAHARGWALDILRAAALRRLLPALDLGPDPGPSSVVGALAERTGRDADEVDAILYGPQPSTDAELVRAADELDALIRDALPDIAKGEPE